MVRLQLIGRRLVYTNSSKNSGKVLHVFGYFQLCENQRFSLVFRSFFAFRLQMSVRRDNQYKTEADGGNILEQPMLFECMGICVLSPAHESEMRGYLVYLLIVKYLSH